MRPRSIWTAKGQGPILKTRTNRHVPDSRTPLQKPALVLDSCQKQTGGHAPQGVEIEHALGAKGDAFRQGPLQGRCQDTAEPSQGGIHVGQ